MNYKEKKESLALRILKISSPFIGLFVLYCGHLNLEKVLGNSSTSKSSETTKKFIEKTDISNLSSKAKLITNGMTYNKVVELLGSMPDTVINHEIAKEKYGEYLSAELIEFEWKNSSPDCIPVVVTFSRMNRAVNGINIGLACDGLFTEPLGVPCSETNLCSL